MLKTQETQLGNQFAAQLISLTSLIAYNSHADPPLIPSHSVWISHLFTWCHQIAHKMTHKSASLSFDLFCRTLSEFIEISPLTILALWQSNTRDCEHCSKYALSCHCAVKVQNVTCAEIYFLPGSDWEFVLSLYPRDSIS